MRCFKGTTGRITRAFSAAVIIVALGALVWISAYVSSLTLPKAFSKHRYICASSSLQKNVPVAGDLSSTASKQMWFIESSGRNGTCLNERQACAIESAAGHNPGLWVNLVVTGTQLQSCGTLELLNSLPNFHMTFLDVEAEFKGAPLDLWYKKGTWRTAKNKMEDLSDALRWLVLWKRGGIYLDLDVIVLQPLDEFDNVAGFEDSAYPGTAVLAFQKGHPFLTALQKSCVSEYDTAKWGSCGPTLFKNVYDRRTGDAKSLCMLPSGSFYPVHYSHWEKLFDKNSTQEVLQSVKYSLAVHLWNKLTGSRALHVSSGSAYDVLARTNCPLVYSLMASKGVV